MKKKLLYIIKSQISYSLYNLHASIIILLGITSYAYLRNFNPLNLLCFLLFVQYGSLVLLSNNKEKRDYTFRLLTLSAKEIAQVRIFLVFIGFVVIYLLAFILHTFLFSHSLGFRDSYHELFMFGGIGLAGIFFYLFVADYFTIFKKKSAFIWFNIISSIIIVLLCFGIIFSINSAYGSSVSSSTQLIVLLYLCSFVFAGISYLTYQKRESYLGV